MKFGDFVIALGITLAVLFIALSLSRSETPSRELTTNYEELTLSHKSFSISRGDSTPARIDVRVEGGLLPDSSTLFLYMRPAKSPEGTNFRRAPMLTVPGEGLIYRRELTFQGIGKEYEYYIRLVAPKDSTRADTVLAAIPAESQFEASTLLTVRFEGEARRSLQIAHITIMFIALLAMMLAVLAALSYPKLATGFSWAARMSLLALSLLIIGVFGLGTKIEKAMYGSSWSGFPVGGNVTDTASALVALYWLVVVLILRGELFSSEGSGDLLPRRIRMLLIIGAALAVVSYLIPHGLGRT